MLSPLENCEISPTVNLQVWVAGSSVEVSLDCFAALRLAMTGGR